MDIEQLKMILDAAAAAGSGAFQVAIMYFVLMFAKLFVFGGCLGGAIYGAYRLIRLAVWDYEVCGRIGEITGKDMDYTRNKLAFVSWLRRTYNGQLG